MSGHHRQRSSPYDHRERTGRLASGGHACETYVKKRELTDESSVCTIHLNKVRDNTTKRDVSGLNIPSNDFTPSSQPTINLCEKLEKQEQEESNQDENNGHIQKHVGHHAMRSKRIDTRKLRNKSTESVEQSNSRDAGFQLDSLNPNKFPVYINEYDRTLKPEEDGDNNKQNPHYLLKWKNQNDITENEKCTKSQQKRHQEPKHLSNNHANQNPRPQTRIHQRQDTSYKQISDQRKENQGARLIVEKSQNFENDICVVDKICQSFLDTPSDPCDANKHLVDVSRCHDAPVHGTNVNDILGIEDSKSFGNTPVTDVEKYHVGGNSRNNEYVISASLDSSLYHPSNPPQISTDQNKQQQTITDKEHLECTDEYIQDPKNQENHRMKCLETEIPKYQTQSFIKRYKSNLSLKPNKIFSQIKTPYPNVKLNSLNKSNSFDSNQWAISYSKIYDQIYRPSVRYGNNTSNIYETCHSESGDKCGSSWSSYLQKLQIQRLKESLGIKISTYSNDECIPESEDLNYFHHSYKEYKESCQLQNLRKHQMLKLKESLGIKISEEPNASCKSDSVGDQDVFKQVSCKMNDDFNKEMEPDPPNNDTNMGGGIFKSLIGKNLTRTMEVTSVDNESNSNVSPRPIERLVTFVHDSVKSLTPTEKSPIRYVSSECELISPPFKHIPSPAFNTPAEKSKIMQAPFENESIRCVKEFLLTQDAQQKFSFKSPSCERQTQTVQQKPSTHKSPSIERQTQTNPVVALSYSSDYNNKISSEVQKSATAIRSPPASGRFATSVSLTKTPPIRSPHYRMSPRLRQTLSRAHPSTVSQTPPPAARQTAAPSRTPAPAPKTNSTPTSNRNLTHRKAYRKKASGSKTTFI